MKLIATFIAGALLTSTWVSAGPSDAETFEIDLPELLNALGKNKWRVLDDKKYKQVRVGNSHLAGRRIVVIGELPKNRLGGIGAALNAEIDRQMRRAGARQKGMESTFHAEARGGENPQKIEINAPRRYFVLRGNAGILDASSFTRNGQIVLTINYLR